MNKKIIVGGISLVILTAVGVALFNSNNKPDSIMMVTAGTDTQNLPTENTMPGSDDKSLPPTQAPESAYQNNPPVQPGPTGGTKLASESTKQTVSVGDRVAIDVVDKSASEKVASAVTILGDMTQGAPQGGVPPEKPASNNDAAAPTGMPSGAPQMPSGIVGEVSAITPSSLTIKTPDSTTVTVLLTSGTVIKSL